jgi:simple sugar transport system ATP-binding protein
VVPIQHLFHRLARGPTKLALRKTDRQESGKSYPIIKDEGGRRFFNDERLLNKEYRITGKLVGVGMLQQTSGIVTVNGTPVTSHSPLGSIGRGVALCPEDRKAEGIVDELTVRENIVLAVQAGRGWLRALSSAEQDAIADRYIRLLKIATPSANQLVRNLSGGNQQKVILARWLATDPQILILDEPTRGIDIGAKAEVQRLVLTLADEGRACVFISSELDEVLRTSHRVVVLRDRVKVDELSGDVGEQRVMLAIAGTDDDAA